MNLTIEGLYVKTYGEPTNQAIIFIHGFPFDHTLWNSTIEEFKDNYYCISYDIRGFGSSQLNSGQYTMESYVEDLENIISELSLNKPIICGFSMGGYIALRVNEKYPDTLKALILANTTSSSDNDEAKLKRAAAISSIDSEGLEPFIDNFLSVASSEEYSKSEIQELKNIKDKILDFDPIGIKGAILAMVSRTNTTNSLKDTNTPILLISSDDDKIITPKTMKDMADKTSYSTFISIKNSGHVSMLENSKDFNNAIKNFFT